MNQPRYITYINSSVEGNSYEKERFEDDKFRGDNKLVRADVALAIARQAAAIAVVETKNTISITKREAWAAMAMAELCAFKSPEKASRLACVNADFLIRELDRTAGADILPLPDAPYEGPDDAQSH